LSEEEIRADEQTARPQDAEEVIESDWHLFRISVGEDQVVRPAEPRQVSALNASHERADVAETVAAWIETAQRERHPLERVRRASHEHREKHRLVKTRYSETS
jgi:hypothetical protein